VVADRLFLQRRLQRIDVMDLVRQFLVQAFQLLVLGFALRLLFERAVAFLFQVAHLLFQLAHHDARIARRPAVRFIVLLVLLQVQVGVAPVFQVGADAGEVLENLLQVERIARVAEQAVRILQGGQRLLGAAEREFQPAAHQPGVHLLFVIVGAGGEALRARQQVFGAVVPLEQDRGVRRQAEDEGLHRQAGDRRVQVGLDQRQRLRRLAGGQVAHRQVRRHQRFQVIDAVVADDLERLAQQRDRVLVVAEIVLARRQVRQAVDAVRGGAEALGHVQRQQEVARRGQSVAAAERIDADTAVQREFVEGIRTLRRQQAGLFEQVLGGLELAAPAGDRAEIDLHGHLADGVGRRVEVLGQRNAQRFGLVDVVFVERQRHLVEARIGLAALRSRWPWPPRSPS
jgi:hypothetical protein